VLLDEGQERHLDDMLRSKAKSKNLDVHVRLRVRAAACRVELAGVEVGGLVCETGELAPIEEAVAAGFPSTAWARIARNRGVRRL